MAEEKKKKKGVGGLYFLGSLLLILVMLFCLYILYEQNRKKVSKEASVERIASKEAISVPDSLKKPATSLKQKDLSPERKPLRPRVSVVKKPPATLTKSLEELEKLRKRKNFTQPIVVNHTGLHLLEYSAFSLGYDEEHEQAAWVAYLLTRAHTLNNFKRRNNFRTESRLPTESASLADYRKSGYDRGHLAPAADLDYDRNALSETFFMTNISPQLPAFNRGGWQQLEGMVREWATVYDSLYVMTGPVLEPGLKKIGQNAVSVPNFFYKIILDCRQSEIKMIGFLMPNEKITSGPWSYVVTVDSIEQKTGIDFFPQLPDILEDSLEGISQIKYWKSTQE